MREADGAEMEEVFRYSELWDLTAAEHPGKIIL